MMGDVPLLFVDGLRRLSDAIVSVLEHEGEHDCENDCEEGCGLAEITS